MRFGWVALVFGCSIPALAQTPAPTLVQIPAQTGHRPTLVELFTSEGCSSCPAADAVVADIARTRPDVLALTFHITYWDNLGWKDVFSFPGATERQRRYVALSVSPDVYTPALVVDGRQDVIGSDRAAVDQALARIGAQARPVAPIGIGRVGDALSIDIGAGTGAGTVLLLGYDSQHQTHVRGGENGGRTLLEVNVVRSMAVAGIWRGQPLRLNAAVPAGENVAVVVQADDGRIVGVGRLARAAS